MAIYLARILRPLWHSLLCVSDKDTRVITLRMGREDISGLSKPLLALKRFCDANAGFIPSSQSAAAGGASWEAGGNVRQRMLDLQSRKRPEGALRVCVFDVVVVVVVVCLFACLFAG